MTSLYSRNCVFQKVFKNIKEASTYLRLGLLTTEMTYEMEIQYMNSNIKKVINVLLYLTIS